MNKTEAENRAQSHAETLGFGMLPVDTTRRGQTWWVIALQSDSPDLGLIVVQDTGRVHAESSPFGPWFTNLTD